MKEFSEIVKDRRFRSLVKAEDGGIGYARLDPVRVRTASVVWSVGGGWDHVSASFPSRCPTWEEMCVLKDIFFKPEEVCVEYHPAESEYVNLYPFCLHIWRPQTEAIPCPPSWMIGPRKGQTVAEAHREGVEALERG